MQEQQEEMKKQSAEIDQYKEELENLRSEVDELKKLVKELANEDKPASTTESSINFDIGRLEQNIPNPFSSQTKIPYYIPEGTQHAALLVTNMEGKVIKQITISSTGDGSVDIDANNLIQGNYFYSLVLDGKIHSTKQLAVIKT